MKSLLVSSVSKTRKVTPMQLMEEIQKIIEEEKKKLSDQKISDLLNKRGFNLARRTISKYRKKRIFYLSWFYYFVLYVSNNYW